MVGVSAGQNDGNAPHAYTFYDLFSAATPNKYEFSQKLSPYNFTWKSSSTSITFQNITMAKASHLYLDANPYLDPMTASKP